MFEFVEDLLLLVSLVKFERFFIGKDSIDSCVEIIFK